MKNTPLISIVFLTYNNADILKRGLDTLLSQTYKNFLIHAYDDCSTDTSYQILLDYAKKDHRLVVHKRSHNMGVYANFLDAIKKMKGDYFLWACPDDVYHQTFLEKGIKKLESNSIAVGFLSSMHLIFTNGTKILDNPESYVANYADIIPKNMREKINYGVKILFRNQSLGYQSQYGCFLHGLIKTSYLKFIFPKNKNAWKIEELFPAWMICLGGVCTTKDALFTKYQDLRPLSLRNHEADLVYKQSISHTLKSIVLFLSHVLKSRESFKNKTVFVCLTLVTLYREIFFKVIIKVISKMIQFDQNHGSFLTTTYHFFKGKKHAL